MRSSITSPSVRPSPYRWRVGIRIFTFEACSGFTHITARWIARPPKATFVTRLQCDQLPSHPARQLPDLSTTIWVDSSSTGDTRPFGAHSDISDLPGHRNLRSRARVQLVAHPDYRALPSNKLRRPCRGRVYFSSEAIRTTGDGFCWNHASTSARPSQSLAALR